MNAGHIPGYILNPAGEVDTILRRTGIPLGLRCETAYHESAELQLHPGQILVMLTDGFEEAVAPDDEMLGTERVLEVVKQNRDRSAAEIVQSLYQRVRDFSGSTAQVDDLTAIVIKVA